MVIGQLRGFNVWVEDGQRIVGHYRLLELLHVGGGGRIYRARDLAGPDERAVKLPRSDLAGDREALRRESEVLKELTRVGIDGVVRLFDEGIHEDDPWYAMELLQGADLARVLTGAGRAASECASRLADEPSSPVTETTDLTIEQRLPQAPSRAHDGISLPERFSHERASWALGIVESIADTLHEVHALGILHGDLSPANIMLTRSQTPVLLDFGTSFARFEPGGHREVSSHWRKGRGTPGYAAPEVLRGETLDARCDVYSLGCIAYELLLQRRPFVASTIDELVSQQLRRPVHFPEAISETLHPALLHLLQRMLEREPTRRTAHAFTVAETLRRRRRGNAAASPGERHVMLFRPRLSGRRQPFARLIQAANEARSGSGMVAAVTADSGMGKTRLLDELAHHAQRVGMDIISAQCRQSSALDETSTRVPDAALHAFVTVIETAIHRVGFESTSARSDGLEGWVGAALRPYVPELLTNEELPSLPELSTARASERVLDALVVILERLSRQRPLLLLLDDAQWADDLSLQFLRRLGQRAGELPLLVVVAQRSGGMAEKRQAVGEAAALELTLAPLSAEESAEVAKDLLGSEALPEGLREFVERHSEGNPLFIAEYVRAAMERGLLLLRGDAWHFRRVTPSREAEVAIPASVEEVLDARTGKLSGRALHALQFAAIIGRDFDEDVLSLLVGDGADTPSALRELVSSQIIERSTRGRYRFSHDKLREAQLRSLSLQRRRELHRSVARQLENRSFVSATRRAALLGYHWAAASEPERALPHLEKAAHDAQAAHDTDAARDLCRLAIAQAEKGRTEERAMRLARLNEALADALATRAEHAAARESYEQALSRLRTDAHLDRARVHRKRASSHWTVHDYENADRALSEAERELNQLSLDPVPVRRELIEVRMGRFELLYFSQQRERLGPLLAELVGLVDQHGTPRQRMASYLAAASHSMLTWRYAFDERALELTRQAMSAANELSIEQAAVARFNHGFALLCGNVEHCRSAESHFQRAAAEAEELRSTTLLSRVTTYAAIAQLRLSNVTQTQRIARRALHAAEASRLAPYAAAAKACLGWALWRSGDEAALPLIEEARRIWSDQTHKFPMRWMTTFALLAYAEAEDDLAAARTHLSEFSDPSMQALPASLQNAIDEAANLLSGAPEARVTSRCLREVLKSAREAGYC